MGLRIALVSSSYDPYFGGVESHVRHVARELVSLGHELEVWTVDRGEHLGARYVDDVLVRYLPTPMPARSLGAAWRFVAAFPSAWRLWREALRSFRPTVLHVQCFGPNGIYAAGMARLSGIPLVLSSHGETFADDHGVFDESALMRRGLSGAMRSAGCVTGCSSLVVDDLTTRFGAPRATVVPNGVDLDELPAPTLRAREPGLIVGVGRLVQNKGFDLLIQALALPEIGPLSRVVLIGDGGEREALARLASDLGVADRVAFTGALPPGAVADFMTRAAVVAVPSRKEAFGIVVLEAWRAGAAVVATTRGGPASIVTDGVDGLVVDPEDVSALAEAVGAIIRDSKLAAALASAGADAVARYTWAQTARLYQQIYSSL